MEDKKGKLIECLRNHGGSIAKSKVKWASDVLNELEKEGKIKITKKGNGYTIELLDNEARTEESSLNKEVKKEIKENGDIITILNEINKKLDIILQKLGFSNVDFDKIFEEVKNPMGIAVLKDIRERMGLSKEEFYSKYSSYIESHFQMFRGGDEGIVKNGTIFGIIKR